jgi:hypothetical protein
VFKVKESVIRLYLPQRALNAHIVSQFPMSWPIGEAEAEMNDFGNARQRSVPPEERTSPLGLRRTPYSFDYALQYRSPEQRAAATPS